MDADIPARVILGDTPIAERNRIIAGFRDGEIRVLVNVLVATEGFDLPDASCVVLTRPTLSLALFMQMVGRGLRPKDDGGDCLILDLAANSITHGLPKDHREWQLEPRGKQEPGEAPTVWCPNCGVVSPAASHKCPNCGHPFGKDCSRCGKWWAWKWWKYENHCGDVHELVCDKCHKDAHIQAHLPITPPLDELPGVDQEDEMYPQANIEIGDVLADALAPLLRELLEQERQSILNARAVRQDDLLRSIQTHERVMEDDDALYRMFTEYVDGLPEEQRPRNIPQRSRMFTEWERDLKGKLAGWRNEFAELKSQLIDKRLVFDNARDKMLQLLSREAQDIKLLPGANDHADRDKAVAFDGDWVLVGSSIPETLVTRRKPKDLRLPDGREIPITKWTDLLVAVAEWIVKNGKLSVNSIPKGRSNYLINGTPIHKNGSPFKGHKKLSNGLYIETHGSAKRICNYIEVINKYSDSSAKFFVRL